MDGEVIDACFWCDNAIAVDDSYVEKVGNIFGGFLEHFGVIGHARISVSHVAGCAAVETGFLLVEKLLEVTPVFVEFGHAKIVSVLLVCYCFIEGIVGCVKHLFAKVVQYLMILKKYQCWWRCCRYPSYFCHF